MNKKLIFPAEVKICATCSFWDGNRKVDSELAVVVVEGNCVGKCLVQNKYCQGLNSEPEWRGHCLWEHLAPDTPESNVWEHLALNVQESGIRELLAPDVPENGMCGLLTPDVSENGMCGLLAPDAQGSGG
jgi:hypothetical protein